MRHRSTGHAAAAIFCFAAASTAFAATSEIVPLFISASHPSQQGFVRIINHSDQMGTVAVTAIDDAGRSAEISFQLDAWETRHFNSEDLENGNAAKGIIAGVGAGMGDWRLEIESALPLESERVEDAEFDLTLGRDPIDIAAGPNGRLYVLGGGAVFAYTNSGDPVSGAHFDLAADNSNPAAITYANRRFYIADNDAGKVFAYTAEGQRAESQRSGQSEIQQGGFTANRVALRRRGPAPNRGTPAPNP